MLFSAHQVRPQQRAPFINEPTQTTQRCWKTIPFRMVVYIYSTPIGLVLEKITCCYRSQESQLWIGFLAPLFEDFESSAGVCPYVTLLNNVRWSKSVERMVTDLESTLFLGGNIFFYNLTIIWLALFIYILNLKIHLLNRSEATFNWEE